MTLQFRSIFTRNPRNPLANKPRAFGAHADFSDDQATAFAREHAILTNIIINNEGTKYSKQPLRTNISVVRANVLVRLATRSKLIGGDLVSTRVSKFAVHAERVVTLVKQSL